MAATFEHPKLETLLYTVLVFYSFIGGCYREKEMNHRLHVQAVKYKKMGFLKGVLVRVLHSISSRI